MSMQTGIFARCCQPQFSILQNAIKRRPFPSVKIPRAPPYLFKKFLRRSVGEAQSLRRQLEPPVGHSSPSAGYKFGDFCGPFVSQVKTGRVAELFKAPPGVHAQTKSGHFTRAP